LGTILKADGDGVDGVGGRGVDGLGVEVVDGVGVGGEVGVVGVGQIVLTSTLGAANGVQGVD